MLTFFFTLDKISIVHVRLLLNEEIQEQVQGGLVALGVRELAQGVQYLDCTGNQNQVTNLEWRRETYLLYFPVETTATAKRLVVSNATLSDDGTYTCSDSSTNEALTINITTSM